MTYVSMPRAGEMENYIKRAKAQLQLHLLSIKLFESPFFFLLFVVLCGFEMVFVKLVTLFALASFATGQPASIQTANMQTQPSLTKVLQIPEYVQENSKPVMSYTLQLPRQEDPIPFYDPEIMSDLQPPGNVEANTPNFFEYPVPSQDLQVPAVGPWNPTGDPAMYYDVIVDFSPQKQPTGKYPKKFDGEADEKSKLQPKQEIEANPLTVEEFSQQIKARNKIEKFANQKNVRDEKVPKVRRRLEEPQGAASESFDYGLSSSITAPLGIHASPGERVEFQMHGHEGPDSYKWGFDTGKGRNRQFRYEERDNDGHVKGHYGYYDKSGKLHVYHYNADPEDGFHSESNTDESY